LGKEHNSINGIVDKDKTNVEIDCSEWRSGVYFVRLTNQNQLVRSKHVVIRKE